MMRAGAGKAAVGAKEAPLERITPEAVKSALWLFRRQMVELVRAGRSPEELAQEFEPTAQSIRNWVGQAECDAGRGGSGLTTAEREELTQLRRENRQLRLERDILSNRRGSAPPVV